MPELYYVTCIGAAIKQRGRRNTKISVRSQSEIRIHIRESFLSNFRAAFCRSGVCCATQQAALCISTTC